MKNSIWPNTKLTERLGVALPIIQAPMAGGATTPELVAAVSNAGALGSFAAGYLQPDEIKSAIKAIKLLTDKPFAVNLFIPEKHQATPEQIERARKVVQTACPELQFTVPQIRPPYAPSFDEQLTVILSEKVPVFSFTFGIPTAKQIETLKKNGVILIGTATSLAEGKSLQEQEIDLVCAQGIEAGGHRGTFIGKAEDSLIATETLACALTKQLSIPVIAAGGIMDAKGIALILKRGIAGVQMGTAFLCCTESGIHPDYKALLLHGKAVTTTLTRAFSGKLARGIKNTFISRMQEHEKEILDYPIQNALTTAMRKAAAKQNNLEFMSLFAGTGAFSCQEIAAKDLIQELTVELNKIETVV